MNTNNRTWIMVIAACAALAVVTGCPQPGGGSGDGSNTSQTVVCPCNPKEHYLPCTCAATGAANCTCVVKPRGYMTTDSGQVPVFMTDGVSDSEATDTITLVNATYEYLKIYLSAKYARLDTLVYCPKRNAARAV